MALIRRIAPSALQSIDQTKRLLNMQFDPPLQQVTFLRRYKRFLADVRLASGEEITIHCPNTGSMRECLAPGSPAWVHWSPSGKRKYPGTWALATTPSGHLAGINTGWANELVAEALAEARLPAFSAITQWRREVPFGQENSRVDFLGQGPGLRYWVEVKNVTLLEDDQGYFPDARTERGQKHLRELTGLVSQGERAALVFCVQHSGIASVRPAGHIDPTYAALCKRARDAGVEFYALKARLSPESIRLEDVIPVVLDD